MPFDLSTAKPAGGGGFDLSTAKPVTPDAAASVASDTPEWERRAAAVGSSMAAPVEGLDQIREHITGWLAEKIGSAHGTPQQAAKVKSDVGERLKGVDESAQGNARAMEELRKASAKEGETTDHPSALPWASPALGALSPFASPALAALSRMGAGGTGMASDVASGFVLPGVKAAQGAGMVGRGIAGGATGGIYGGMNPVTSGGDFATEKAKQTGTGATLGATITAALGPLLKTPGAVKNLWDKWGQSIFGGKAPEMTREAGQGAEKVTDALTGAREKIEGKVADKTKRAEGESGRILRGAEAQGERVRKTAEGESAETMRRAEQQSDDMLRWAESRGDRVVRNAETKGASGMSTAERAVQAAQAGPRALNTTTAGEFGAVSRDAMAGRKSELEIMRDTEAMPQLDAALNSGAEVNISGIPKQIDLMLKNEKNTDIQKALQRAKDTLFTKEGAAGESADDILAQMRQATPGSAQYRELATRLQTAGEDKGPQLDTSMRGLDSARLAINHMMTGKGANPADKFAAKQLGEINRMLEDGMATASPEYGKYLDKYRELSKPLDPFSAASGAGKRTAASLQKDKFEGDWMTSPESMGNRFFKSGDEGAASAREFKTATNNNPEAVKSMGGYIASKLQNTPPEKWDTFLNKHEAALKEFGLYDQLSAYQKAAASAEEGLKKATTSAKESLTAARGESKEMAELAKQAGKKVVGSAEAKSKDTLTAAQKEVKEFAAGAQEKSKSVLGKAAQTEKNVGRVLKETAIGKLTSDAATFRKLTGTEAQARIEKIFESPSAERELKQTVSALKKNPEAQAALQQSYMDWLAKRTTIGEIDTVKMLDNWQATRGAIERSGLFDKEHVADVDAVMTQLKNAFATSGIKRTVGNAAGWMLAGGYKGAYIGRQIGRAVSTHVQKDLENIIVQMATDPAKARVLNSEPTDANISKLQKWIEQDFTPEAEKAFSIISAREATEQKPKRRAPPDPRGMSPNFSPTIGSRG